METFKSGNWRQQDGYKSFEPALVNRAWSWEDSSINSLLEDATRALGELNAFSLIVPDVDMFIGMHVIKEAQTSSKIEGIKTDIDEVLMPVEEIHPERRDDWREVQNFIQATNQAVRGLETLPLSNRVLKQAHETLMQGVRGQHKQPGEFRKSQNWIGGANLQKAVYVPPQHTGVTDLMSDLEKFWHNERVSVPHLIRIAVSHYQFETIHPFLDGNGRVGRLLIPLYLISHGLLKKHTLYMSDFFERNRRGYYDALTQVRSNSDLSQWVKFFLIGMRETAVRGRDLFERILSLRTEVDGLISTFGKRVPLAHEVMKLLYSRPIVSAADLQEYCNITNQTANVMIKSLIGKDILQVMTEKKRNRTYAFKPYLDLFLEQRKPPSST